MSDTHIHAVRDPKVSHENYIPRKGEWLTQSHEIQQKWVKSTLSHVESNPTPIHPTLQAFQEDVERDPRLTMLFATMFDQVPRTKKYNKDPIGQAQVRSVKQLVKVLNHILQTAPEWTDVGEKHGFVGVPINCILDWPMGTPSGFAVFQDPTVNGHLKKILNTWGEFLRSPASAYVFGTKPNHWFGTSGMKHLTDVMNNGGETNHTFEEAFVCEKGEEHMGYKSWDHFFTRLFKDGIRPVAGEGDDNVVVNPCESRAYKLAKNVHATSKFWVKGQPYSVMHLLDHDKDAHRFVAGTIWQAFLSALSYHRWHSPVSGTIVSAYVVDGSYFSEPLYEDFTADKGADEGNQVNSEEYISAVATRAVIIIKADNPKIGYVAVVPIGMVEVSTCDITVKEGQKVKKGEQLGMFHFGGSTCCTLFQKGVELEGFPKVGAEHNVPVLSELCRAVV